MSARSAEQAIGPEEILDPAVLTDPFPFFARLRRLDPVHWSEATGSWYVAAYDDVHRLLTDERLGSAPSKALLDSYTPEQHEVVAPVEEFFCRWLVFSDPPHQLRMRTLLQRAFTPAAVTSLRPLIEERAAAASDSLASATAGADVVEHLARPFALDVVSTLLGIAPGERAQVLAWSDALMAYIGSAPEELDRARAARAAIDGLIPYVTDTVIARGEGRLAEALGPGLAAGELAPVDAAAVFAQLLTGGIEPLGTGLAGAMLALHQAPDQLADVRQGVIAYEHAVEESLRHNPPFHFAPRHAIGDLTVGGRDIRRGQRVVLLLASANRDEQRFPNGEQFNARRGPVAHLAFGRGGHYCLGAVLARTQIAAALRAVDRRLPKLRLDVSAARREPSFGRTILRPVPAVV